MHSLFKTYKYNCRAKYTIMGGPSSAAHVEFCPNCFWSVFSDGVSKANLISSSRCADRWGAEHSAVAKCSIGIHQHVPGVRITPWNLKNKTNLARSLCTLANLELWQSETDRNLRPNSAVKTHGVWHDMMPNKSTWHSGKHHFWKLKYS